MGSTPLQGIAGAGMLLLAACGSDGEVTLHASDAKPVVRPLPEPPAQTPATETPSRPDPTSNRQPGTAGPPVMEAGGSVTQAGWTAVDPDPADERQRRDFAFNNWGIWAGRGSAMLFTVHIHSDAGGGPPPHFHAPLVAGARTGSNPTTGSATWSGNVRAYDWRQATYGVPVEGTASLEVDLAAETVDVRFTDIRDYKGMVEPEPARTWPDLEWSDLRLVDGTFANWDGTDIYDNIEGAFYGAGHEGVAGRFTRGGLEGVFGALREQ